MKTGRLMLILLSAAILLFVLGGGLGVKVGAADNTFRQVILFSEVLSLVLDNYVDPVETDRLLEGAYEGLLGGLDAQGAYLNSDEVARWKAQKGQQFAGPGITVLKGYGVLQVVSVSPDSPAERAGLESGDQIRAIDGVSIRDLSLRQAQQLLRGSPETKVKLTVLHPGADLAREELTLDRVMAGGRSYELNVTRGIGVLRVHRFADLDTAALGRELDEVRSRGIQALLLDLRNAVDQDPRAAALLAGLFDGGDILSRVDREGNKLESIRATDGDYRWPGEVFALVNGATAGAAEAVASILKAGRGAVLFGESTYGLGAETELFELQDGSGLLVSTSLWTDVTGRSWNDKGIEPDRKIDVKGRRFTDAYAEQLERTLEAVEKELKEAPRKAA